MPTRDRGEEGKVFIAALDESSKTVEEIVLSVEEYYEAGVGLIDSSEYWRTRRVQIVRGEIYDLGWEARSTIRDRYDETGHYLGSRAEHADGQIFEE